MTTLYAIAWDVYEDHEAITWDTVDSNPHFNDWEDWPSRTPFHLCRAVSIKNEKYPLYDAKKYALTLLRIALDQYASDYAFVYQTTWPVLLRDHTVERLRDIEASVFEERGYLVASTLVFPGFKEDLMGATK